MNGQYAQEAALANKTNYNEAIEKYQIALTYSRSTSAYNAYKTAMLDTYYRWGQSLQDEHNYSEAIEKYQTIYEIDEYYKPKWINQSIYIDDKILETIINGVSICKVRITSVTQ